MLIEVDGCIFDQVQLKLSNGFENLDKVGKEAFVNHIHLDGKKRLIKAQNIIDSWIMEFKEKWPKHVFRNYKHVEKEEITIRFHLVRSDEPNWCVSGTEIIEIKT